jgi:hypothetical protein
MERGITERRMRISCASIRTKQEHQGLVSPYLLFPIYISAAKQANMFRLRLFKCVIRLGNISSSLLRPKTGWGRGGGCDDVPPSKMI